MALPTCEVSVRCYTQDGQPDPGARVTAVLNHAEVYQGYIIPKEAEAIADASGVAVLTLFRNALGSTSSFYRVRIESTDGRSTKVNTVVPDQATAFLDDISTLPPYPGKPDAVLDVANFATLGGVQSLTNKTLVNPHEQEQALVDGPVVDWDVSAGQTGYLTLSTNQPTRTLNNPKNMLPGSSYMLVIAQGAAGGQTITTFGSAYSPVNGLTIRSAPNAVTILLCIALGTKVIVVNLGTGSGGSSNTLPPVNTVPAAQVTPHDTALVFTGANNNTITVSDADSSALTTTVSATNGTLTAVATTGATVTNNGTASVTIAGSAAQINAALFGLSFTPTLGFSGSATLTVNTSDGLNADIDTVAITVATAAGNHPPVNTVPTAQNVAHDTPLVFSTTNGNAISVTDADGDALTTTVAVDSGTLTAVAGGGATITTNGTASVQIDGTIAQVNAALNGLSFSPTTGFSGAVTLTVTTSDGTDSDIDTVVMTVAAAPTTQADTVQPLVRHPVDWLQIGKYFVNDGRWGFRSSDPTQEPDLTEGTASYQYEQFIERSLVINAEDESVGWRIKARWPEFNINGHAVLNNSFYSEVKTYPSIIFGSKPGFFGSSMWPAFSFAIRAPDGGTEPVPNPSFTPQNIKDDWQPAGGTVVQTAPSGASPGSSLLPMQLPLTGKTCRIRGKLQHNVAPTGMGHVAFDMFLTETGPQIQGHVQSSLTHEIMIPLGNWGNYGKFGFRNPQWYDHDVTIDGVLYHVYYAKRLDRNPVTGVHDGNGAVGYYPGLQYNFGGLDTVNGYINEETGQPRVGWKFIVFQHDGDNHPMDANGYFNIDYTKFIAHLAAMTDERGVAIIRNVEFLPAIELGSEIVYGTLDLTVYNYMVQVANTVVAAPPLPVFGNHAPVNTVPGAQSVVAGNDLVFSTANGNLISVSDVDIDALTTTVSVGAGTLTAVVGGGAIVSNNGTATVTISGSPTQVNAALDGLSFTPAAAGAVTLTVQTTDGSIIDSDTVAITVSAVDGAALIQAQFTAGNNGTWLHNGALTEFYTDGVGSTNPAGWTDLIGRWINHGNTGNAHDLVQADNANRFQLGTDVGGRHFAGCYNGAPLKNVGGSTTAFYCAIALDVVSPSYDCVILSDRLTANTGVSIEQEAFAHLFYARFGTGAAIVQCQTETYAAGQDNPAGKVLLEFWFDGTNVATRLNKGVVDQKALGTATISAGELDLLLLGNYPLTGSTTSNSTTANVYECVVFKDYCPSATDRDNIATYVAAQAGLTV